MGFARGKVCIECQSTIGVRRLLCSSCIGKRIGKSISKKNDARFKAETDKYRHIAEHYFPDVEFTDFEIRKLGKILEPVLKRME
mgnify:CR=1 FL=1